MAAITLNNNRFGIQELSLYLAPNNNSNKQPDKMIFTTLLVEDDDEYRNLLRVLLCHRFPTIKVTEAGDGECALAMIAESPPDLVLLDISLPGIDGLTVTRKIREMNEDITIVILSGYDIQEYRHQAFRDGAECFIYKGAEYSTGDVLARVEGTIKRNNRRLLSSERADSPS